MKSIAAIDHQRLEPERIQEPSPAVGRLFDKLPVLSHELVRSSKLRQPLPGFRWSSVTRDGKIKFVVIANAVLSYSSPTEFDVSLD